MNDIFKFWSQIERGAHIHPDDAHIFARLSARKHGFDLTCLPAAFAGPLKTAKVVLLFWSPGFSREHACGKCLGIGEGQKISWHVVCACRERAEGLSRARQRSE